MLLFLIRIKSGLLNKFGPHMMLKIRKIFKYKLMANGFVQQSYKYLDQK